MQNIKSTILELKEKLEKGEVTSVELVKEYIAQIHKVDEKINAYLHVAEEKALAEAEKRDEERSAGELKGPLHGIPIALKDNIAVEGMQNTNSSKFMKDFIAPYDSTVAVKLKQAGAIILGKLNMDEFAMGSATEYSGFGDTNNPWNLEHVPGGSSGGSGAAVAGLMAPVSLGTDTGGSVRQPAAFNNLVGLKPTYGRISRYGVTAFASTLDQVGIFTRTVKDCALVTEILAGMDSKDSTSADEEVPHYLDAVKGVLTGVKLALPRNFLEGLKEPMLSMLKNAVETYRRLGATVDEVDLQYIGHSLAVYYVVSSAEASSNLARFDGIRYGHRAEGSSAKELYTNSRTEGFGTEVKNRIMLGTYVLSAGYYDAYYNTALKVRTLIKEELSKIFETYDAIIGPTTPMPPRKHGEKPSEVMEEYLNDLYTVSANIAGIPAISFPAGFHNGLPLSCQLMGSHFDEARLFNIAYAFEKEHDFTETYPEEATK